MFALEDKAEVVLLEPSVATTANNGESPDLPSSDQRLVTLSTVIGPWHSIEGLANSVEDRDERGTIELANGSRLKVADVGAVNKIAHGHAAVHEHGFFIDVSRGSAASRRGLIGNAVIGHRNRRLCPGEKVLRGAGRRATSPFDAEIGVGG